MNAQKTVRIAFAVTFTLIFGLLILYLYERDLPLGETYKPISEYGGEFKLYGYEGEYELADFEGKVVVMYFGFLNCTEACPQSMQVMRAAFNRLEENELEGVQGIFVSVDPDRDSRDDLKDFAEYYHRNVVAMTGTHENIDQITKRYGVYFDMVDLEGSAMGYTVDHSSRFYLIDKTGGLYTAMSHSTTPNELAARIRELLNK